MPVVNKEVFVDVTLSPEELATMFWEQMCCDEHAAFFNHLGKIAGSQFPQQMQSIIDEPSLNITGLQVLKTIGEYADV